MMDDDCHYEEREARATLSFMVCQDHFSAKHTSASLESPGIPPDELARALIGLTERVIAATITEWPEVQEFVGFQRDDGTEVLGDRGKSQLIDLLAHQFLLDMTAQRTYATGGASATMSLPMNE